MQSLDASRDVGYLMVLRILGSSTVAPAVLPTKFTHHHPDYIHATPTVVYSTDTD